ncbi:MAG TPA: anti-sigma factor [Actinocatenispora sp.]
MTAPDRDHASRAGIRAVRADARVVAARLPDGGQATMVLSDTRDEGVATVTGLRALPGGRTYQLWLMSGGVARSVGVLDVGQDRDTVLVHGARRAGQFGISTEPAGGSRTPSNVWASMDL